MNKLEFINYIAALENEIDLKYETIHANYKIFDMEPLTKYRNEMLNALETFKTNNIGSIDENQDPNEFKDQLEYRAFILDRTILPDDSFNSSKIGFEDNSLCEHALSTLDNAFAILGKLFLYDHDKAPSKEKFEFFTKYILKQHKHLSVEKFDAKWVHDAKVKKPWDFVSNEGHNQLLLEFDFLHEKKPVFINQDLCASSLRSVGSFDKRHVKLIKNIHQFLRLECDDLSEQGNYFVGHHYKRLI